jgi:hypothetical protein
MVRLRSVGVLSCAKIYGIIHMALGILFGVFFVLIGIVGLAAAPGRQKVGMIGFLVIAALSPFIYGALGFVIGAVGALLYNWIASAVGGIEMELQAVPLTFVASPPPDPIVNPAL